jgi:hypothetical protein
MERRPEGEAEMDGNLEQPTPTPEAVAPKVHRRARLVKLGVGLAAAAGVAVGATALAGAATTSSTTPAAGSTTTTTMPAPGGAHRFGPRGAFGAVGGRFGAGGFGGIAAGIGGAVVHGQFTVKGPKGYETLAERTGTVSAVSDTSGATWSLTVKSADGTSQTFTVNGTTSVNGGESGISSVKDGDAVTVVATVASGATTATQVTDRTTLQANGKTWMPQRPQPPSATPLTPGTPPSPPAAPTTTSA